MANCHIDFSRFLRIIVYRGKQKNPENERADKGGKEKKMKVNDEKRITIEVNGEEITATAGMLNTLSIFATEAEKSYDVRGLHGAAADARIIGKQIYEKLIAVGYYD